MGASCLPMGSNSFERAATSTSKNSLFRSLNSLFAQLIFPVSSLGKSVRMSLKIGPFILVLAVGVGRFPLNSLYFPCLTGNSAGETGSSRLATPPLRAETICFYCRIAKSEVSGPPASPPFKTEFERTSANASTPASAMAVSPARLTDGIACRAKSSRQCDARPAAHRVHSCHRGVAPRRVPLVHRSGRATASVNDCW